MVADQHQDFSSRIVVALAVVAILITGIGTIVAVQRATEPSAAQRLPESVPLAAPADYYTSPAGRDDGDGLSPATALRSIQRAVDRASPGSTIHLGDGAYVQDVRSKYDARADAPITITGSPGAVIKGTGGAQVIDIGHDHHVLRGFTVDGLQGPANRSSSYRRKLVLIQGGQDGSGVTGVRVLEMTIQNASGECVRLRRFAHGNELAHNRIIGCGVNDFRFAGDGKNGEGVYIGTAPEQLGSSTDGKARGADRSDGNQVHHNTIDTLGNECVDIKEGSSDNVVEHNSCTGQRDPESGGLDVRGNHNVLRYNLVFANRGAGIRLGGNEEDDDGVSNDVYGNTIENNARGGVKFMRTPQGTVCGNDMSGNASGDAVGEYGTDFDPDAPCG